MALISTKNIMSDRIYKDITLNLSTPKPDYKNLILIASDSHDEVNEVIKSGLFRPAQLAAAFTPRTFKTPITKKMVRIDQKDYYANIKKETNGKIKLGKATSTGYNGRNIYYNTVTEFRTAHRIIDELKGNNKVVNDMLNKFMEDQFVEKTKEIGYDVNYLIFPMRYHIASLRSQTRSDAEVNDENDDGIINPVTLFLKAMVRKKINLSAYKKINRVFFYVPGKGNMVSFDINNEEDLKNFPSILTKILRLNDMVGGIDNLDDIVEDELSEDDIYENKKEQVKNLFLNAIAKQLKANLTSYESASKEEQDLMSLIDAKVDNYLDDPEFMNLSFKEMVERLQRDNDIKAKAIRFITTKKIGQDKLEKLGKNLDKEIEIIDSITELDVDGTSNVAKKFTVKDKYGLERLDQRVLQSRLASLDSEYASKQARKDLISIITAFSNLNVLKMTLADLSIEDTSDDFNEKETVKVTYKVSNGKSITFRIDIPKTLDGNQLFIDGTKYSMNKQLTRLPIVKTKADRVEISTALQKMTIERSTGALSRKNAYFLKMLKDLKYGNKQLEVIEGYNLTLNQAYDNDFGFEELSASLSMIKSATIDVYFNRVTMKEVLDTTELPANFIDKHKTPFAMQGDNILYYIEDQQVYKHDIARNKTVLQSEGLTDFLLEDVIGAKNVKLPAIGKSYTYTKVKFLTLWFPVFTLVGMIEGITNILRRYDVKYSFSTEKRPKSDKEVEVEFRNKYLYYEDTLKNTMLLNILYAMNTEEWDYEDFDRDAPYLEYFSDKMNQKAYVKNTILINLDKMIDPITYEVLRDLEQPTDIIDLLLLANTMLTNNTHDPLNDMKNYRIRGTETIYALMYSQIASAITKYENYTLNGNPKGIEIGQRKLISDLIQLPTVNTASILNPVLELEALSMCGAKGHVGVNLNKAYNLEMRTYDESMLGILSANSTPFSGNVGITRGMVYDPEIDNIRGYLKTSDINKIAASNMISAGEMVAPFTAAQADAPRAAMQIAQTKHTMPTVVSHRQLFGSGVNKTMALFMSDDFSFKAKKDGVVKEINEENEIIILDYTDGTRDAIDIGGVLVKNSSSGFSVNHKMTFPYKVGDKFQKGDVLAVNPSFFGGQGTDVNFKPGCYAKIAIVPGDFVFEDSTLISDKLAAKTASNVTMSIGAALSTNHIISKIANVGDQVKVGDHLLEFSQGFEDDATTQFLQGLSGDLKDAYKKDIITESVDTKYTGRIVDIKMYYNHDLEEFSPSIQEVIANYTANVEKRRNYLKKNNVRTASVKIPPVTKQTSTKIEGKEFDGLLIVFYVEYNDVVGPGDKLVYATALKGIVSTVVPDAVAPEPEHRSSEKIEGTIAVTGTISRMTLDIYAMLYVNKVLIELGKQIKEIWEGKDNRFH